MTKTTLFMPEHVAKYVRDQGVRESETLRQLRERTAGMARASMQIAPEQGALLALLVRLMSARQIVEIGTFTGYSALAMAEALPTDGRLVACDRSREWTDIAREYWRAGGVSDRIDLRIGDAAELLDRMLADGETRQYDLCFIDADKPAYGIYYERALELLRPGGLIAVDNTLWGGRVADSTPGDRDTGALREFNQALRDDDRIDLCLLPVADGVTLARKR